MGNKLCEIMRYEQKELQIGFSKASLEGRSTPQEVADRREELIKAFFKKYFPFPNRVVKGNIIDSYGEESDSIDCIILNPAHPYTIDSKNSKASVIMADGVDFAIEVKGELNSKKEIQRALRQVFSVKKLQRVKQNTSGKGNEYFKKIPTIIYTNGIKKNQNDFVNDILEYYIPNKISRLYQFDMIVSPDAIIYNSCLELPSLWDTRDWFFLKSGQDTLTAMLYLMTCFPLSGLRESKDILTYYLRDFLIGMQVTSKEGLSKLLVDLDNGEIGKYCE